MKAPAKVRAELRPHGTVVNGCEDCLHLHDCGGIEPEAHLFNQDCLMAHCCVYSGDPDRQARCDNVCPHHPRHLEQLREIGGLTFHDLPPVPQTPVRLPLYIPLIHHRYCRRRPLDWPVVGLDTYQVVKVRGNGMTPVANDPEGLRQHFRVSADAKVVLRGIGTDRSLERYWAHRRRDDLPDGLARLGVLAAVGPNFSHFLDVPRHDNMFNRKRQVLCLDEFVRAGLNPVPHLNAAQPGDWNFWERFLAANRSVTVVAVEFETGNRSPAQGRLVVARLIALQQALGRPLHPLVVGGTQYLEAIAPQFEATSFLDSTPFVKTIKRQAFRPTRPGARSRWRKSETPTGWPLDDLLAENLKSYSKWLDERWCAARRPILPPARRRVGLTLVTT